MRTLHYPFYSHTLCSNKAGLATTDNPKEVTCGHCKKSLKNSAEHWIMNLNKQIHDSAVATQKKSIQLDKLLAYTFKMETRVSGEAMHVIVRSAS